MKWKIIWLRYFHLRNFLTWVSWSGFGVTTKWPKHGWEEEIRQIDRIFKRYLPKDWIGVGPFFATGGVLVMYAWPKDDPNIKGILEGDNDDPALELDYLIEQTKKVLPYVA